jgi:hypothetical protein
MSNPNQPAYLVVVVSLSGLLPQGLVLTPEQRAYFEASIGEGAALRAGAQVESTSVLDELLRIGQIALPAIVGGKVTGYGPLRARWIMDLGQALASRVDQLDAHLVQAAGASTARGVSLLATRALRRDAMRALKSLAGTRKEDRARLKEAAKGREAPDERARSLAALADELERAIASAPPGVAEDAGATPALVGALRQAAAAVLTTRGSAQGARGSVAGIYDEMNLLDGRILHELRLLVGAMRDARREDKSVPLVSSTLLGVGVSRRKKKAAAKPAPAAAPNGASHDPTPPHA